ncbi:hypothetical protein Q8A67_013095 [Cirrhinus molitorella]|uniref:Ig-like domain-containing protein n=1 Tax=Cirrhinus molitorella TaxID=172907 RepID=A0AA88PZJ6_9TELE|nr:hypothetical protein Q8A67_013095 [Cirrhinus molitorella]
MWYKDGTGKVFDSSSPNTGLLKGEFFGTPTQKNCTTRFNNVNQNHNGSYYFRLEANGVLRLNYRKPTYSQVQLAILEYPPKPTVSVFKDQQEVIEMMEMMEGSSVSLRCSSKIFCPFLPPNLTWSSSLNENITGRQHQIQTELISELNFTVSHRHHKVTFTCNATNQLQQQITTQESRMLRVQYAPKNTSVSVNPAGFVLEGNSVTLSCSSDANPPLLNYTWYRDTEGLLNPVQTGPNLTINNTNSTHSGRYYCTAENKHGTQNTSVLLDVQYVPKNISVWISPAGLVLEGGSVTLSCSSDANPAVNYTWYRDTEGLLNPVQTGPNLTINNTNSTYSGRYYCTAENKHGTQNTSVLLDVQYAPKNTLVSAFPSSSVMEGNPVTLSCSSDANPAELNYTWYTETGSQIQFLQTGYSNIYIVTNPTNGAWYGCKAQNQHGQYNATIQLDVQFVPKISSSCSRSSVIACVCEAHGNPCPTLQWRLSGQVISINSTETSISEEMLGSTGVKSVLTTHHSLMDTDVLQCFSSNIYGSASQMFQAVPPPPDTSFHYPSVLLGAAVGVLVMIIVCIVVVCCERWAVAPDNDRRFVYTNKDILPFIAQSTPEPLHYSSNVFTNTEPSSGEIRGITSRTFSR